MTIPTSRRQAIEAIAARRLPAATIEYTKEPVAKLFGENVFSAAVMRAALPKEVHKILARTMQNGQPLDPSIADTVANAMKDWAISRGATHYTHWFHPMTGLTAEKHDSFLVPTGDGQVILEFSGRTLIKGEPDASSFPSGGIRSTFEARGYTAWDPTSPAFLMDGVNGKTLCIPTAFCSYTGEALDKKTPLLRSIEALNKQALRVLRLFGNHAASRVGATVGPEQEYFLIDRNFYLLRADLINAGRTLFGARPPKGQEMEDHYFGSIKDRVLAFMMDAERELYKLGIPIKTRHNEVAPAQFEIAPVFEQSNMATDHNMLVMEVLRKIANKHGLECLLHEKPFAGINGSGKHNNWSLSDDLGNNLFEPGRTPHENAQFLVFLTAVIRAVDKYGKLLRAAIATAGNDHRLGANEAPPAIISIYLGDKLTEVVQGLIAGRKEPPTAGRPQHAGVLQIGVSALPALPKDDSDRNRTSPFAFTGNKFEFRAVGSSQSVARPNTVLNTIVAESLDFVATEIEKTMSAGNDLSTAVHKVVQSQLRAHERILFNGDNYSAAWHAEAERRGLPNLKTAVAAAPALIDEDARAVLTKYGVYSNEELESRYTVLLENYCKTINIEALLTSNMARTMILPAALQYQHQVALSLAQTRTILREVDLGPQEKLLKEISAEICALKSAIDVLDNVRGRSPEGRADSPPQAGHDPLPQAKYYQSEVIRAMNEVRGHADDLEAMVDDQLWPLPKYREMLYIY